MTRQALRSIAVVSCLGLVTACAGGDSAGPAKAPVASVVVSPLNSSIIAGESQQLAATLLDNSGNSLSGRAISWSSSNTALVAVSSGGLATTIAAGGPITITASSEGKSGTASINVLAAVAVVSVTPPTLNVATGTSAQLTATPRDAGGNPISGRIISWSSSNPSVAAVSVGGVVTGVAAGSAVTITATSDGKSGSASVSVFVPVATVVVSPASSPLAVGSSLQLAATLRDASGNQLSGRAISWTSNSPSIANVSASGVVTGIAPGGPVIVIATSEGQNGSAAITVFVPVALVSVTPTGSTLSVGVTAQLTATPRDANNNALSARVVTWLSSNPAVATVSSTGLLAGVALGSATITATCEGVSGTSSVTVFVSVATVGVTPTTASVAVGATTQLTATPRDANGNSLTGRSIVWMSGNTAVATVSNSGVVTGVSAGGPVTITASSEGRNGVASVTVTGVATDPCQFSNWLSIALGTPINGTLATSDCALGDGSFVDYYRLTIAATVNVQIDLSAGFDTFLGLLSIVGTTVSVIATDDDSGPGTDSRISRVLTPGTYAVAANSFAAGVTGAYQLSIVQLGAINSNVSDVRGKGSISTTSIFDLSPGIGPNATTRACGYAIVANASTVSVPDSGNCLRKVKR